MPVTDSIQDASNLMCLYVVFVCVCVINWFCDYSYDCGDTGTCGWIVLWCFCQMCLSLTVSQPTAVMSCRCCQLIVVRSHSLVAWCQLRFLIILQRLISAMSSRQYVVSHLLSFVCRFSSEYRWWSTDASNWIGKDAVYMCVVGWWK